MNLKKILSADYFLSVYLLVILFYDLLLINFPLTNIFGFEYSALNSLFLILLSGVYFLILLRKNIEDQQSFFKLLARVSISFLLIPLLVGILNSFFSLSCPLRDGILFFIVITLPSVLIGSAIAIASYSVSKRISFLIFFLFILVIVFIPIAEIYFNPQVYFYNPLITYFPGTIYDEGLSINLRMIIYRLFNIIFFGGIFYFLLKNYFNEKIISKNKILIGAGVISFVFIFFSSELGFSTSQERVKSELRGEISTPHFTIYYSSEIDTTTIKVVALHHEYYYKELSEFFKHKPEDRITSFVFNNNVQKGKLFGSANADVAKPWLSQIYITVDSYNTTLRHELAHVFSKDFASGIFKISDGFNPSLIEGIASAADPVYDEKSIDYVAAIAYKNGYKISLTHLFGYLNFFMQTSGLSYVYSGAFVKFLIDNYGIEKFKILYSDLNFEKIYKKSLKEFEKEFYLYLESFNVTGEEHTANYYFGRKSIFHKVCPRYVADRLERGWEYFSLKQFGLAAEIFQELYQLSESYPPLNGWINTLENLNNHQMADSILTSKIEKFKGTAYYYNLQLKLADLSSQAGNYLRADSLYKKIIYENPNNTLYYIANMRRDLLVKNGLIKLYSNGNNIDKYLILRELNQQVYNYFSFPVLIDLSRSLNEDYKLFLRQFNKTIIVNSYSSAYGVYKLSIYMLLNLDITMARRMAALSLRYNDDENLKLVLQRNYEKTNWFFFNAQKTLDKMKIKNLNL